MTRPIEFVERFAVDDARLNSLHALAFGIEDAPAVRWRERLERHALTWVGAFSDRRLVGFVQVAWDGGAHAFLLDTVVDPQWQHRGIGTGLVRTAVEAAAAAGCRWIHVDFEEHLSTFYLRQCGFRATAAGVLRLCGSESGR